MKVAVFPRDSNPYQSLLHAALSHQEVEADYLSMPTPSQTLNLLLLPVALLHARWSGVRILHLHWLFTFTLPGSGRLPVLRWLAQLWLGAVLRCCRLLGINIVWTAHNVLPHDRVFWNDRAARRLLLRHAGHVIVHDDRTSAELAGLLLRSGTLPPTTVVPHGSYIDWYAGKEHGQAAARAELGLPAGARILLFFGRVSEQKGILELIDAFRSMGPAAAGAVLVVAGRAAGAEVAARLAEAAAGMPDRLRLDLRFLPDAALAMHLAAADAVVLPFRQATTSGSAVMALTAGRPAVLPDLAAFADFPDRACLRYDHTDREALRQALAQVCALPRDELAAMGAAGRAAAELVTWDDAALRTATVYRRLVARQSRPCPGHDDAGHLDRVAVPS